MAQDKISVRTETKTDVQAEVTDGTNIITIKPASTASIAGDTAQVVALSPNTPLPAGTNAIGTVTANAGTGTFTTSDLADTGVAAGSAPTKAVLTAVQFNTTLPTLTTGQTAAIQSDASARQIMVGAGTAGTAAGGVVTVQGVASMTPVIATGSGTAGTPAAGVISVQGIASGTNLNVDVNAALPAGTNTIGNVKVTDGTNFQPTGDAVARPIITELTDGTNILGSTTHPVQVQSVEAAGTQQYNTQASAALAAQASATLSFTDITTGKTGTLTQITLSGEVPVKAVIQTFDGTTGTAVDTIYTVAGGFVSWTNPYASNASFQQAGGTGKHFRVIVTNNNTSGIGASGVINASGWWTEA